MNLFVVDGKNDEFAVFECLCSTHKKRETTELYITGANHYCSLKPPADFESDFQDSIKRQSTLDRLLSAEKLAPAPDEMIRVLADPGVEQDNVRSGTVYSTIACPSRDLVWFAGNGFPAASKSTWEQVKWNW